MDFHGLGQLRMQVFTQHWPRQIPQGCIMLYSSSPFERLKKNLEEPWADSAFNPPRILVRKVLDL